MRENKFIQIPWNRTTRNGIYQGSGIFQIARFLVKKESETLPDSVCIVCAFGFGLLSVACYQLKRHGTFFSSPKKFNGQMWQNKNDPLDDFIHVNFLVGWVLLGI